MIYATDYEAKARILDAGRKLYGRGLVSGNEGNISHRVGPNEVWVTPTYESKGYLNEDMLVKLDLDGNILAGAYQPSSEVKMHLGVYKENPTIMAVIHAHPITATAYACCGVSIPANLVPETIPMFGEKIQIVPFGMPGTRELPDHLRPFIMGNRAALLESHGAISWGETMKEAYFTMETLENYCKLYTLATKVIGAPNSIPEYAIKELFEYHLELDRDIM